MSVCVCVCERESKLFFFGRLVLLFFFSIDERITKFGLAQQAENVFVFGIGPPQPESEQ